jgi:aspartyl protease family protein
MMKPFLVVAAIGTFVGIMMPGSEPEAAPVASVTPAGPPPAEVRLDRRSDGHFYVHGEVNGQLARFLVDTGASFIALTVEDAERLGVPFSESEFQIVGTGASGPVRGQEVMLDKVVVEGREVTQVRAAVLEGLEISLLGQSFLSRIGSIQMSGDTMILQ